MTIRQTKNATTKTTKRNSGGATKEVVTNAPVVIDTANNSNIAGADITAGNPISYRGYEHIPVGTDQYDVNA